MSLTKNRVFENVMRYSREYLIGRERYLLEFKFRVREWTIKIFIINYDSEPANISQYHSDIWAVAICVGVWAVCGAVGVGGAGAGGRLNHGIH
jgi:hypothetical protein